ncbi:unnamed protein product, partial [Urochloa humidicola]
AAEGEATAGGSSGSTVLKVWQRGPSQLPRRPIPLNHRPKIRPKRKRGWEVVEPGSSHKRKVNGILGLLCRKHFPGLVTHHGIKEPAYSFDHYYIAVEDFVDEQGRRCGNKAERVLGELW